MIRRIGEMFESSGDRGQAGARGYSYKLRAECYPGYERISVSEILADPMCPKEGYRDPFDINGNAYITRVEAERQVKDGPHLFWIISVDSSTAYQTERHPISLPAVIEISTDKLQGITFLNNQGQAIYNTAGDLLPFPINKSNLIINISKNYENIPYWFYAANERVNVSSISIKGKTYDKGTLLVGGMSTSENEAQFGGLYVYYESVRFQLYYKEEGWNPIRQPNVGFNQIAELTVPKRDPDTGKILVDLAAKKIITETVRRKIPILLGPGAPWEGEPPSDPQPLDRQGKYIDDPQPQDLITIENDGYLEMDFGVFPLDARA